MRTVPVRLLGDSDRGEVQRVLDLDPYAGVQVAERVAAAGLAWWRLEARIFGYGSRRRLESLCWLGANLVPVRASDAAVTAFAELIAGEPRACSSIVGSADAVLGLWQRLQPYWDAPRDIRPCQPLLATDRPAPVPCDPEVRLVRPDEIDLVYPAAVAMYAEEVGVSPLVDGGEYAFRGRIVELVESGRMYARIVDGRAVFKAELAIVTGRTAQVQGVWTAPEWRGRGLGTTGMAAVVSDALLRVAPTVSLYVNDYNTVARRVYERCGFHPVGTFATVLF